MPPYLGCSSQEVIFFGFLRVAFFFVVFFLGSLFLLAVFFLGSCFFVCFLAGVFFLAAAFLALAILSSFISWHSQGQCRVTFSLVVHQMPSHFLWELFGFEEFGLPHQPVFLPYVLLLLAVSDAVVSATEEFFGNVINLFWRCHAPSRILGSTRLPDRTSRSLVSLSLLLVLSQD